MTRKTKSKRAAAPRSIANPEAAEPCVDWKRVCAEIDGEDKARRAQYRPTAAQMRGDLEIPHTTKCLRLQPYGYDPECSRDHGRAEPPAGPSKAVPKEAADAAFPPSNTERENGRGPWYWVRAEAVTGPEEPVYHLSDGRGGMRCHDRIPGRVIKEEPRHPSRRCLRCKASLCAPDDEPAVRWVPPIAVLLLMAAGVFILGWAEGWWR